MGDREPLGLASLVAQLRGDVLYRVLVTGDHYGRGPVDGGYRDPALVPGQQRGHVIFWCRDRRHGTAGGQCLHQPARAVTSAAASGSDHTPAT